MCFRIILNPHMIALKKPIFSDVKKDWIHKDKDQVFKDKDKDKD